MNRLLSEEREQKIEIIKFLQENQFQIKLLIKTSYFNSLSLHFFQNHHQFKFKFYFFLLSFFYSFLDFTTIKVLLYYYLCFFIFQLFLQLQPHFHKLYYFLFQRYLCPCYQIYKNQTLDLWYKQLCNSILIIYQGITCFQILNCSLNILYRKTLKNI
ncbi:transmembrane protein, putative (macronuclear) [Tetrahymena thermophila SB210]|uniref:Transmembrane protein, putative n=1 Tax=Tetrahymena thermophila (strain SB210) TaxID=312017 RepID=W7X4R3_TETTS|nr:transmembrane protein, putative [Tetrahymena thermophila SB210]EWS74300.1 transmembrane protein, putative [Tetrahymena thermophila SB210]|eukprot:XP_012653121.1 transmembrane protein, putative [Tetrahymena thermophila SB210]